MYFEIHTKYVQKYKQKYKSTICMHNSAAWLMTKKGRSVHNGRRKAWQACALLHQRLCPPHRAYTPCNTYTYAIAYTYTPALQIPIHRYRYVYSNFIRALCPHAYAIHPLYTYTNTNTEYQVYCPICCHTIQFLTSNTKDLDKYIL